MHYFYWDTLYKSTVHTTDDSHHTETGAEFQHLILLGLLSHILCLGWVTPVTLENKIFISKAWNGWRNILVLEQLLVLWLSLATLMIVIKMLIIRRTMTLINCSLTSQRQLHPAWSGCRKPCEDLDLNIIRTTDPEPILCPCRWRCYLHICSQFHKL